MIEVDTTYKVTMSKATKTNGEAIPLRAVAFRGRNNNWDECIIVRRRAANGVEGEPLMLTNKEALELARVLETMAKGKVTASADGLSDTDHLGDLDQIDKELDKELDS